MRSATQELGRRLSRAAPRRRSSVGSTTPLDGGAQQQQTSHHVSRILRSTAIHERAPHHGESGTCDHGAIEKLTSYPCGHAFDLVDEETLPPPLPEPNMTYLRRVLPPNLVALNSPLGQQFLLDALTHRTAASYLPLTEQFINQSDPAFCGVTTLVMVCNTFCIDPQVRWKGGWRYFGDESVLLSRCCMNEERIRRVGVTLEQVGRLASCQGMNVELKRPDEKHSVDEFRQDVIRLLTAKEAAIVSATSTTLLDAAVASQSGEQDDLPGVIVASFSRKVIGQTGDGHFSPIAAYHATTDQVLILDVARFKYPPYWVGLNELYHSMQSLDPTTQQPRGWLNLRPPRQSAHYRGTRILTEQGRPATLVPVAGQGQACPLHRIKIDYCQVGRARNGAEVIKSG